MGKWLKRLVNILLIVFISFGTLSVFCAFVSLPFWLLWNWLVPDIFGLPTITWLQAGGLWVFMALINTLGFNYTKTLQTTKEIAEDENLKWNDVFLAIKKNYTA